MKTILNGSAKLFSRLDRNVILRREAPKNPFPCFTRDTDPSASPQDDITRV